RPGHANHRAGLAAPALGSIRDRELSVSSHSTATLRRTEGGNGKRGSTRGGFGQAPARIHAAGFLARSLCEPSVLDRHEGPDGTFAPCANCRGFARNPLHELFRNRGPYATG